MIDEANIESAVRRLFEDMRFTEKPEGLYDPLRYMIEIGGKRLRPRLCLSTYALFKDEFGPEILEPAAALEVFHSFTLIHDDIMDRSPLRRKVPTVWKKWDEDTAILSGDAMCIDSYARVAKAPAESLTKVLALFSKTAAQVCEGQQYDMEFESRDTVGMEEYMKMIGYKTGALIACSAEMGALIAGADDERCQELYDYGYDLGLAFQVQDDYLDAYGDEIVFGKPIGGDILNKKKSWLTVRAMEKAGDELRDELISTMASDDLAPEAKIAQVKGIYATLGIADDAKEAVLTLTERALAHARKACEGERYEVLRKFAGRLLGRES